MCGACDTQKRDELLLKIHDLFRSSQIAISLLSSAQCDTPCKKVHIFLHKKYIQIYSTYHTAYVIVAQGSLLVIEHLSFLGLDIVATNQLWHLYEKNRQEREREERMKRRRKSINNFLSKAAFGTHFNSQSASHINISHDSISPYMPPYTTIITENHHFSGQCIWAASKKWLF